MKIGLILPGSIWYAPYVRIYTSLFDANGIEYDIISWNREGDDRAEGIQYNEICKKGHGSAGWSSYKGYIKFIKVAVKENGYHKLVVFGPQMTCLLSWFLLTRFRKRFIIDYRDLSIEQKIGFKQLFSLMLKNSYANVVSSPGFLRCLPKKRKYYICHNFDKEQVCRALSNSVDITDYHDSKGNYKILTIGAIRDYFSNIEVVKALGNVEGFSVQFVGKGKTSERIEEYCKQNGINNVFFKGFYQKPEEEGFVKSATLMNIFYPRIITHDTALSNRFYNSLIFRKPMIVTKNTTQGDFAEKYNVGIAVETCDSLADKLNNYLAYTNFNDYSDRCTGLLKDFLKEQDIFEDVVLEFVK